MKTSLFICEGFVCLEWYSFIILLLIKCIYLGCIPANELKFVLMHLPGKVIPSSISISFSVRERGRPWIPEFY